MSVKGKLTFVGQTDTGRVREHNEDTIAADSDAGLLVLADGMGGYNAGEVASGIAVKTITNLVREGLAREDLASGRASLRSSGAPGATDQSPASCFCASARSANARCTSGCSYGASERAR